MSYMLSYNVIHACIQIIQPPSAREVILDNVSNFLSAMNRSLSLGTVRMHIFSVDFNFDVFRFLFSDKGRTHSKGRGLLYDKNDYASELFHKDWDIVLDRLGDGCRVEFPVQLRPVVKCSKKCFFRGSDGTLTEKPRTLNETVCVTLFKQRCLVFYHNNDSTI